MGAFKTYSNIKSSIKKFIPDSVFKALINPFHWFETVVAMSINGFPQRGMSFIGVTGTNGKTTTSIMIAKILEEDGYSVGINTTAVVGYKGDYKDNQFALTTANPFQIHKLLREMRKNGVDTVVMEVASHALVQHRVWGLKFDAAVFTNLSRDHLDYHKTMENYAAAKGKLFSNFPKLSVINKDDEWFEFFNKYDAEQKISFGTDKQADCRIVKAKLGQKGSKLLFKLEEYEAEVKLQIPGKYNAYNALAAASVAYGLGVGVDTIREGLQKIDSIPGRSQIIDEGQDFVVMIDHAHTEDALENLLTTVRSTLKGRLICLIGADGDRDSSKRGPLGKIAAENSELVIVTDQEPYTEDPKKVRKAVLKGAQSVEFGVVVREIPDRREAIKEALKFAKSEDVVVIPGLGNQLTRGMKEGKMEWDEREVTRELLKELLEK